MDIGKSKVGSKAGIKEGWKEGRKERGKEGERKGGIRKGRKGRGNERTKEEREWINNNNDFDDTKFIHSQIVIFELIAAIHNIN